MIYIIKWIRNLFAWISLVEN